MLSMRFVEGFEYVRELVEEPPYCAKMVFVIMSCSCWIDNEATEVDCSHRGVFSITLPSSSFVDVNL